MHHYKDSYKEQYERIPRKPDWITSGFLFSLQSYSQTGYKRCYRLSDVRELPDTYHLKTGREE